MKENVIWLIVAAVIVVLALTSGGGDKAQSNAVPVDGQSTGIPRMATPEINACTRARWRIQELQTRDVVSGRDLEDAMINLQHYCYGGP